jgi:hypothetical protein
LRFEVDAAVTRSAPGGAGPEAESA